MRKFCFICGKSTEELEGGRCKECAGKKVLVKMPKRLEAVVCAKCGKMLFRNRWTDFNLEKIVEDAARTAEKIKEIKPRRKGKKIITAFILSDAYGKEKSEIHEADFHISKVICPSCSRKHSGYYEAVLQMRGFEKKDFERLKDVFEIMERKTFFRIKEVEGGLDIKIGNRLAVDSAAKMIRAKFPVSEMKKSSKIVTKIDGRDVHRKFILIRKNENKKDKMS